MLRSVRVPPFASPFSVKYVQGHKREYGFLGIWIGLFRGAATDAVSAEKAICVKHFSVDEESRRL
jgi:hypothetical protein